MRKLIDDSENFLLVSLVDKCFYEFLKRRIQMVSRGLLLFNRACILGVSAMTLWTLFTKKLMYISYVPKNSSFWFYVIYSSQVFLDVVALATVLGYVCFFVSVVVNIILQYRILQYELSQIKMDQNEVHTLRKLKSCIKHHAFLLR